MNEQRHEKLPLVLCEACGKQSLRPLCDACWLSLHCVRCGLELGDEPGLVVTEEGFPERVHERCSGPLRPMGVSAPKLGEEEEKDVAF